MIYDQVKWSKIKVDTMYTNLKAGTKEKEALQQERKWPENDIEATCHEVPEFGFILDMIPEDKVIMLGEFVTNFHHKLWSLRIS